jgi:hypothetical protein
VIGAVCRFETLCWEWHYNKARSNITNVNIRSCNAPSYRKQEYIQTGKSLIVILLPQLLYKATLILKDTCPVFARSLTIAFPLLMYSAYWRDLITKQILAIPLACHIYWQLAGNRQVSNICTNAPLPWHGKYLHVTNVWQTLCISKE